MAFRSKDIEALPPDMRKKAMAQLQPGDPLTKERQLMRSGGMREKKGGRIQRTRTWSERWKRWFDSGMECEFADETLWPRHQAGDIKNIEFQVTVVLIKGRPSIRWKVDFAYDCGYWGERVHVEFKGFETDKYKLQRNIWAIVGPTRLLIYKKVRGAFECTENIWPANLGEKGGD